MTHKTDFSADGFDFDGNYFKMEFDSEEKLRKWFSDNGKKYQQISCYAPVIMTIIACHNSERGE